MSEITVSRLTDGGLPEFREFCEVAWGERHPLVFNEQMFEYYYRAKDGGLNFALARDDDGLLGVCGYIPANSSDAPDVWISFLVCKKGAPFGLSYQLFDFIRETTHCATFACNNIRPKTRALYEFLGYRFGGLTQYYRINTDLEDYTLCIISSYNELPLAAVSHTVKAVENAKELERFDFESAGVAAPHKDFAYFKRRYFDNPWYDYSTAGVYVSSKLVALGVYRVIEHAGARVLRVVDFLGREKYFPALGRCIDEQMRELGAEFCDVSCAGMSDEVMLASGFVPRKKDDVNILPNYLSPPIMENTDFYYFTDAPDAYRVFRADGDQDKPYLA